LINIKCYLGIGSKKEEILKKEWINEIIKDVKNKLQLRTASTSIKNIDLYKLAMNLKKIEKFENIVNLARSNKIIKRKKIQGFEVIAKASKFNSVSELRKISGIRSSFSEAFQKYDNPYEFLQELKKIEGLQEADFYKFFVNIDYKILNEDGSEVSGGERSEFNLLQEIEDAQKYDMLLIDEPESSFDNLFLKRGVNEIIRDIANDMPVVLVTHNSTVGASINPDYILYTRKAKINGNIEYKIYSGNSTNKELRSLDGETIDTFDVTMGCLEAGEDTYNKRKESYENLKNRE
jgi:ABC-type dipeptide/oligopeptide/nickel transport system ATPase subunit